MGSQQVRAKPFHGPRIKIKRARRHILELGGEIERYFSQDPIISILDVRETAQGATYSFIAATRIGLPEELPAIFGDAIHNLRSALDIMANDVVALAGVEPKKVYFPFAKNETELNRQIKEKMRGASPDVHRLVRELKPYKGGNTLLSSLHDLDIRDKHTNVIETPSTVTSPALTANVHPGTPPRLDYAALRFGEVPRDVALFVSPPAPGFKRLGVMLDAELEAVIAEGLPLGGDPAIAKLEELTRLVEEIVAVFETHCFPGM